MDTATAARIRGGDEAAFGSVFEALYSPLCTYVNGMLAAPDIAEEVVQDVFVKLWQNRATLDVHTSLTAYLYRAVRNASLNQLDRRRTERRWYRDAEAEASEASASARETVTERLEAAQVAATLEAALQRLPPRCRQVFELRWRHGLKHAEIAQTLGISIKGVENHLARGLHALREELPARPSR